MQTLWYDMQLPASPAGQQQHQQQDESSTVWDGDYSAVWDGSYSPILDAAAAAGSNSMLVSQD
jgi:hypothetical protein